MEESGSSFEEQAAVASEVLIEQWYKITSSKRRAITNQK